MEVIDADWIKQRLSGKRGEKAALAEAVGIAPAKLTNILTGHRRVQQEEIEGFLKFFGVAAIAPSDQIEKAKGFAESTATQFKPKPRSNAEQILKMAQTPGGHPVLFRLARAASALNLSKGDFVIADLKRRPIEGETVVCTLVEPNSGASGTHIRQWLAPWLVAGDDTDKLDEEVGNAAILGPVIGILRGKWIED
ncbi:helix-turn-helix transcriptional regulator [Shimia thalassica]|uniref:helix-turn-helix domain-containing protein n=1 Tax=Shimia thalassica TaxID=1715693 RepID=UPI002732CA46|nr:helix-turn-helix transcriptional regulator [Shimia thalassica]MDP2495881.1 helix-turn-helix transcriptional regulator [Shimia thalassica]